MPASLKYAVVERERRYLVAVLPPGVTSTKDITDHYVTGTRLRLREVREHDGTVTRKLGHKVRLTPGPEEVACTTIYLNDDEWALLSALPARTLRKKRHLVDADGWHIAVDEFSDGSLLAEIDDGNQPSVGIPDWLDVVCDVSNDETWTGGELAQSTTVAWLCHPGVDTIRAVEKSVTVQRQPGGDTDVWRDILAHRDPDELGLVVARFKLAGVSAGLVSETLRDFGDALFSASRSNEPDWTQEFGGGLAVALLAAEVSALAAHLNSRAASVRAFAVELLLDDFSAVSVADELGVSRQKVYDIARASHRTATYIPRVPWRSHEHHV